MIRKISYSDSFTIFSYLCWLHCKETHGNATLWHSGCGVCSMERLPSGDSCSEKGLVSSSRDGRWIHMDMFLFKMTYLNYSWIIFCDFQLWTLSLTNVIWTPAFCQVQWLLYCLGQLAYPRRSLLLRPHHRLLGASFSQAGRGARFTHLFEQGLLKRRMPFQVWCLR